MTALTTAARPWAFAAAAGAFSFVVTACAGFTTVPSTASPSPAPPTLVSRTAAPDASPAPSPSSPLPGHGRIAFNVEFGPHGDDVKNIFTIEPDGSGLQQLTHLTDSQAGEPNWTPDGLRIVYVEPGIGGSRISSMAPDGSDVRILIDGRDDARCPVVSPDGLLIAFCDTGKDELEAIHVMAVDGSNVRRITEPPTTLTEGDWWPDFSPDGRSLVFTRDGQLFTIGIDGTGLKPIGADIHDAYRPRWSPDGSRILIQSDDLGGLVVVPVDGSDAIRLGTGGEPAWSPDGTWIVFQRWLPGTHYIALVVARADGGGAQEIWTTPPDTNTFIVDADWGTAP